MNAKRVGNVGGADGKGPTPGARGGPTPIERRRWEALFPREEIAALLAERRLAPERARARGSSEDGAHAEPLRQPRPSDAPDPGCSLPRDAWTLRDQRFRGLRYLRRSLGVAQLVEPWAAYPRGEGSIPSSKLDARRPRHRSALRGCAAGTQPARGRRPHRSEAPRESGEPSARLALGHRGADERRPRDRTAASVRGHARLGDADRAPRGLRDPRARGRRAASRSRARARAGHVRGEGERGTARRERPLPHTRRARRARSDARERDVSSHGSRGRCLARGSLADRAR